MPFLGLSQAPVDLLQRQALFNLRQGTVQGRTIYLVLPVDLVLCYFANISHCLPRFGLLGRTKSLLRAAPRPVRLPARLAGAPLHASLFPRPHAAAASPQPPARRPRAARPEAWPPRRRVSNGFWTQIFNSSIERLLISTRDCYFAAGYVLICRVAEPALEACRSNMRVASRNEGLLVQFCA